MSEKYIVMEYLNKGNYKVYSLAILFLFKGNLKNLIQKEKNKIFLKDLLFMLGFNNFLII